MKNSILTVMSKEFARFFGDKRMIVMILLPAILIYVVYSFMGVAVKSMYAPSEDYMPTAYALNMPNEIASMAQAAGINVKNITASDVEVTKDLLSVKSADLLLVFPPDFIAAIDTYDVKTAAGPAPNIEIYFNSTDPNSASANSLMVALLDAFESSLANKFDINRGVQDSDAATAEDMSASIISSLMPMLLLIFMYAGCSGIAPESIAGEKERGTLATLLVTPLKRSQLASGKILSLGALSFMSGLITALATILSLPKLMGDAQDIVNASIYGAKDYVLLVLLILSTILLLVALISIISAFARTVKEATTAVMPLMILVMLVGVTGMFGSTQTNAVYYLIPLYSSVQSMSGIFSLDYSAINIVLSCVSNLVLAVIGGFALTKMFNSEKVMFSK
jgi:sodium transport system permease protein